jgi:hypothetical protein
VAVLAGEIRISPVRSFDETYIITSGTLFKLCYHPYAIAAQATSAIRDICPCIIWMK